MEPNEIALSLRGAATKWEATHPIIGVGQLRVHDAMNDAADCIEKLQAEMEERERNYRIGVNAGTYTIKRLQAELEASQRRERAAVMCIENIEDANSGYGYNAVDEAIFEWRGTEREGE